MKRFCGNCESMHEITEKKELREYEIKNTKVSAEITILTCNHCGEEIYDRETEINNDRLLFDSYKSKNNLLTSKDIIGIREKYGLSQSSLALILGVGLKTITRYENGSIQDSAHDSLLRLIDLEEGFLLLWSARKTLLSAQENKKIELKIYGKVNPTVSYDFQEQCITPYTTTISENGGMTYDGC